MNEVIEFDCRAVRYALEIGDAAVADQHGVHPLVEVGSHDVKCPSRGPYDLDGVEGVARRVYEGHRSRTLPLLAPRPDLLEPSSEIFRLWPVASWP